MKSLLRYLYTAYMRRRLSELGRNSFLSPTGIYRFKKQMRVKDNVYVGPRAIISAKEGIIIGNGVIIGPEFMVMGGDHNFRRVGSRIFEVTEGGDNQRIVIEDDVWIGGRVVVLKGLTIGEGAIVGAGTVVTHDITPYAIFAGNPARRIGTRFSMDELRRHLEIIGSKYALEDLDLY
jgi:acetyltransferase-like isoleucine patch superfamily enzyme